MSDSKISEAAVEAARSAYDESDTRGSARSFPMRAAIASRQPGAQEHVAVVGPDFTLLWAGSGPISPIVERHGLKRGSLLYAAPPAQGIDLGQLRALAEQWEQLEYPLSYEGQQAQRAADACRADLLALIDGQRDAAPGVGS